MDAKLFLSELLRMCLAHDELCSGCPLKGNCPTVEIIYDADKVVDTVRKWHEENSEAVDEPEPIGANLINRHDATEVIRKECLKCNNMTNEDLLMKILALPTSQQTDCTDFIEWLLEVVLDDEHWELNAVAYGEVIARQMKKLGLLEVKDGYYIRQSIKPIGDLISRADAIEAVCEWGTNEERNGNLTMAMVSVKQGVADILFALQSADITDTEACHKCQESIERVLLNKASADRPTGKWIVHDHGVTYWYKCNRCGGAGDKEDKFCKHCGAKMGVSR